MKRHLMFALVAALAPAASAVGADKVDIGKREYLQSCVTCHGTDGKGKGPFAQALELPVPDLSTLAKRNSGVFPVSRVFEVIDGQQELKAHGPREMPIWGKHYSVSAAPSHDDYAYNPEAAARARILALVEYLFRLQAK